MLTKEYIQKLRYKVQQGKLIQAMEELADVLNSINNRELQNELTLLIFSYNSFFKPGYINRSKDDIDAYFNKICYAFVNVILDTIYDIYISKEVPMDIDYLWYPPSTNLNNESKYLWITHIPNKEKNIVDLSKLKEYLQQKNFEAADIETSDLLIKLAKKGRKWPRPDDLKNLPIEFLYEIDQLWLYYSESHFGIKVIYEKWLLAKNEPHNMTNIQIFESFMAMVGWEEGMPYHQMQFDIKTTPKGHLPSLRFMHVENDMGAGAINIWRRTIQNLILRIDTYFNHHNNTNKKLDLL